MTGDVAWITSRIGYPIAVDPSDARGQTLVKTDGAFNVDSHRLWETLVGLQTWDIVVDVGCNYGEMISSVDLSSVGRVVAFEPNSRILPFLRRTIDELPWAVELVEAAVADHESEAEDFADDLSWSGSSRLGDDLEATAASHDVAITEVRVTTLSAAIGDSAGKSACIKIDVEGREQLVLDGGIAFFDRLAHAVVMIEILHMPRETLLGLRDRWTIHVFDRTTGGLLRLPDEDAVAERILDSRWIYPQDAVLVPRAERHSAAIDAYGEPTGSDALLLMGVLEDRTRSLSERDATIERQAGALGSRDHQLAQLRAQVETLAAESDREQLEAAAVRAELEALRGERAAWLGSRSYWLTRPLRALTATIGRVSPRGRR
ncbi:FkbM family methyltransferase [Leifsonia sp. YIM 134122]|uniref:FkbM family methyltransferase n=1 Tax=Leifsonia stereocauli TaxID=3134136 RepID=A0ABU9W3K4_9MICO